MGWAWPREAPGFQESVRRGRAEHGRADHPYRCTAPRMTKDGKTLSQAEKKAAKNKKIAERAAERTVEREEKAKMWAAATPGGGGDDTSAGKKLTKKEKMCDECTRLWPVDIVAQLTSKAQ